jgi:hypothetical protein
MSEAGRRGVSAALLAIAAFALVPAAGRAAAPADQSRNEGRAMYEQLRTMALHTRAGDLGIQAGRTEPVVFGIVMDMDIDGETATLVAFETGDASLYLSTGGGMIGGGAHRTVAEAARRFVAAARAVLSSTSRTEAFPTPGRGETSFYLLTTAGTFAATRTEERVAGGGDTFSALFAQGQEVLTQLRLAQPSGA